MKLTADKLDIWKEALTGMLNMFEWGVLFFITDCEKIIWRKAAEYIDMPQYNLGESIKGDEAPAQCIKNMGIVIEEIPRSRYGMRLKMQAIPIFDQEQVIGSLVTVIPLLHPIARAFEYLAPVIAAFFPEGASLLMTDLEKYTRKIDSEKFAFDGFVVGRPFKEEDPVVKAIESKQIYIMDYPEETNGLPVRVVVSPIIDNTSKTVTGNFIMCIPRSLESNLSKMSERLRDDLNEITHSIVRLSVSASRMKEREIVLNAKIEEVYQLSEKITEVIGFLRHLADETRMVGLNSAIESLFEIPSGFGLLAREIRKLSDESQETAQDVTEIIELIKTTIDETRINSDLTMNYSHEQVAATKEINYKMSEIGKIAERLAVIAKVI